MPHEEKALRNSESPIFSHNKGGMDSLDDKVSSQKVVAGEGFEPPTLGL